MRERRRIAFIAVGIAALLLMISLITPAIGGFPFKNLRKRVSAIEKKVDSIQAQQGLPGPQGAAGVPGAPGPGAVAFTDFARPDTDNTSRLLGTAGDLTLEATCFTDGGGNARLRIDATSVVSGQINGTVTTETETTAPTVSKISAPLLPEATTPVLVVDGTGGFEDMVVTAVYSGGGGVVIVNLHGIASENTNQCFVQGAATPAA